jgi:hypothetical protein
MSAGQFGLALNLFGSTLATVGAWVCTAVAFTFALTVEVQMQINVTLYIDLGVVMHAAAWDLGGTQILATDRASLATH